MGNAKSEETRALSNVKNTTKKRKKSGWEREKLLHKHLTLLESEENKNIFANEMSRQKNLSSPTETRRWRTTTSTRSPGFVSVRCECLSVLQCSTPMMMVWLYNRESKSERLRLRIYVVGYFCECVICCMRHGVFRDVRFKSRREVSLILDI